MQKNDFVTNAMIRRLIRNSESIRAVPEAEYQKYVQLIAVSEQVWAEAKEKNDFSYFRPYLDRIFKTSAILRNTGDMKKIHTMHFWVTMRKTLRQKRSIRWRLS